MNTPRPETYTLSLHDALPIYAKRALHPATYVSPHGVDHAAFARALDPATSLPPDVATLPQDRKSTRLNSSHSQISYAVFCLKKKTWPDRAAAPARPAIRLSTQ